MRRRRLLSWRRVSALTVVVAAAAAAALVYTSQSRGWTASKIACYANTGSATTFNASGWTDTSSNPVTPSFTDGTWLLAFGAVDGCPGTGTSNVTQSGTGITVGAIDVGGTYAGTITMSNMPLTVGSATESSNDALTLNGASGSKLTFSGGTGATLTLASGSANPNITVNAGTVTDTGGGNVTVNGNLTVSGAAVWNVTKTLTVTGNLTDSSSGTFTANGITLSGGFTHNAGGGTFSQAATQVFNAIGGSATLDGGTGTTVGIFIVNASGTKTITGTITAAGANSALVNGSLDGTGTLNVTSTQFDIAQNASASGAWATGACSANCSFSGAPVGSAVTVALTRTTSQTLQAVSAVSASPTVQTAACTGGGSSPCGDIPNLVINKTGATNNLTVNGWIRTTHDVTWTSLDGSLLNGTGATFALAGGNGSANSGKQTWTNTLSKTFGGTVQIGDGFSGGSAGTVFVPDGSSIRLGNGTSTTPAQLVFDRGTIDTTSTGTVEVGDSAANFANVVQSPPTTGLTTGGNITINVDGTAVTASGVPSTTISGPAAATNLTSNVGLPPIVVNQGGSGATVFSGHVRLDHNLTVTASAGGVTSTASTPGAAGGPELILAGAASGAQTIGGAALGSAAFNDVTLDSGGAGKTITVSGTLPMTGNLNLTDGVLDTGTIDVTTAGGNANTITQGTGFDGASNSGQVQIDGAANQTLVGANNTTADLPRIVLNKSAGVFTMQNTIPTTHSWLVNGVTAGGSNFVSTGSELDFRGGTPTFTHSPIDGNYNNVTIGGGTVTVSDGSTMRVDGTLKLTSGSLVLSGVSGTGAVTANGNVTAATTYAAGTNPVTVSMNGTAKTLSVTSGSQTSGDLPNITFAGGSTTISGTLRTAHALTRTSGTVTATSSDVATAAGATLSGFDASNPLHNLHVYGATTLNSNVTLDSSGGLDFQGGVLATGSNTLSELNTSTTANTNASSTSYVNGNLNRAIPGTGTGASYTWDVGGATNYTPATITFPTLTQAGSITVSTTSADATNKASWPLSATKYVKRYFTVTNSATPVTWGSGTASAKFSYKTGDIQGGATEASFVTAEDTNPGGAGSWTSPSSTADAVNHATTATGLTSLQSSATQFAIGQSGDLPPVVTGVTVAENPDSANQYASGSTVYVKPGGAGGTFRVTATATDDVNLAKATFPSLTSVGTGGGDVAGTGTSQTYVQDYTWANGASPSTGDYTVTATDSSSNVSTATNNLHVLADSSAPTSSLSAPASNAKVSGTVTLTASSISDGTGSGAASVTFYYCDSTGGPCTPTTSDSSVAGGAISSGTSNGSLDTTGLTNGHKYTIAAYVADNVGNAGFSSSVEITVDNSAPVVSITAPAAQTGSGFQWYDSIGNVLWLNATQAGSFKLQADATDADSGISKVNFPTALGTSSNDQTTPVSGSTYASSVYSFDGTGGAISSPGSLTITASNGVTVPSAGTATTSITVGADSDSPAAFSLGTPAGSAKVKTGVVLSASPTDASSGIKQVTFYYCDVTAHPACDPTNTGLNGVLISTVSTATAGVYSQAWTNTAVPDGHSVAIEAIAADEVGHTTTSSSTTVLVDNSAPSITATTPAATANATQQYWSAGAKTLFLKAGGSGSFKLEATATDGDSGIAKVNFPAALGTISNDQTTPTSGSNYESSTYTWDGTGTPIGSPGALTLTATNGVTDPSVTTSTDSVTVTADGTAPSTTVTFPTQGGSYLTSTDWDNGANSCSGSPTGQVCGTVTDGSGAGVAKVTITLQDTTTGSYWGGTAFDQVSAFPIDLTPDGSGNWAYALDHTKLTVGHAYALTAKATDNVTNVENVQTIDFSYGADTTPPDTTLTSSGTHHYLKSTATNAYTFFYNPAALGSPESFTIADAATDVSTGSSGIKDATFPDLSAHGFTGTGGTVANSGGDPTTITSGTYSFGGATAYTGTATVTTRDNATSPNTTTDTITFAIDGTAPDTGGTLAATGTTGSSGTDGGWSSTGTFGINVNAYGDSGSGVATQTLTKTAGTLSSTNGTTTGTCDYTGQTPQSLTVGSVSETSLPTGCYLYTLTATDQVGNTATKTIEVRVDTTAPSSPSLALGNGGDTDSYVSGTTAYFRTGGGANGGTFTVTGTPQDFQSGIKQVAFPSLTGSITGGGSAVTSSPYTATYTWSTSSSGSTGNTVTASNNSTLTSTGAFAAVVDNTAPTGGSLTVNGATVADGGSNNTTTYNTSGSYSLSFTGYGEAGPDATNSGLNASASTLVRTEGALMADACDFTGGATTTISANGTENAAAGITTGRCYRYVLTGTDNVGNATSVTTIVKVDTSPPTAPTLGFDTHGNTASYASGSRVYLRTGSGSAGGTFTVSATTGDPETAIQKVNFPNLGAHIGSGGDDLTSTYSSDYTWDTSAASSAGATVTAYNDAGNTSTSAFDVVVDNTAPGGGGLAATSTTAAGGGYSTNGTFGITVTPYSEATNATSSGLATQTLTRTSGTLASDACDYTGQTPQSLAVGNVSETTLTTGCYLYTLTATDNVGNTTSTSITVKVDTSGPTGGSVTYFDGPTTSTSGSISFTTGTAPSGIASWKLERRAGTLSGTSCSGYGSYAQVSTAASPYADSGLVPGTCYQYELLVTDNAGHTDVAVTSAAELKVTSTSVIRVDTLTGHQYQSGGTLYVDGGSSSFQLELTSAGQSGVASADWADGTTFTGGAAANVTTAPFLSGTYGPASGANDSIALNRHTTLGATVADTLQILVDNSAPTGTIDYTQQVYGSLSVPVTTSASDGGSGLASQTVQRYETSYDGASCGSSWTGPTTATLVAGADATVTDNHCYVYRLALADHVANSVTETTSGSGGPNGNEKVAMIPNLTPPTFVSAATDNTPQLTIHMSKTLAACSSTPVAAFTVTYDGVAVTPTGVSCAGSDILLALPAPGPNDSQTVQVSYSKTRAGANPITDTNPTPLLAASFGPSGVTNGTTDTVAPTLSSASVNGVTLTMSFDQALAGSPLAGDFVVKVNGSPVTVSAVSVGGSTVTLTVSPAVTSGQTVTVTYTGTSLTDTSAAHNAVSSTAIVDFPVTNATAATSSGGGGSGGGVPPRIVQILPLDGSTVASVSTLTLIANETVDWTQMRVTLPDGSTQPLADRTSAMSIAYSFPHTEQGLYVINGHIAVPGLTGVDFVPQHFTIWVAPSSTGGGTSSGTAVPPVQENAFPTQSGSLTTSDGKATMIWPTGVFGDHVIVQMAPQPPAAVRNVPANSLVVDVTAFLASNHAPVTALGNVVEIQFPNVAPGIVPYVSQDGATWRAIPALASPTLPDGQADGFFRDSASTVHVYTRHLTFYALTPPTAQTTLALKIINARRVWTTHRPFVALHLDLTAPARLTTWFVDSRGKTVRGTTQKTKTLHAGVTILRLHLRHLKPGYYRIQVRAKGVGQSIGRTARLQVFATQPWSPLRSGRGQIGVVVLQGLDARLLDQLGAKLGARFTVTMALGAMLFNAVDPRVTRNAGVVLDLDRLPVSTVAALHAVLPELQIVGLTSSPSLARIDRAAGATVVIAKPASVWALSQALRQLLIRTP